MENVSPINILLAQFWPDWVSWDVTFWQMKGWKNRFCNKARRTDKGFDRAKIISPYSVFVLFLNVLQNHFKSGAWNPSRFLCFNSNFSSYFEHLRIKNPSTLIPVWPAKIAFWATGSYFNNLNEMRVSNILISPNPTFTIPNS